LIVSIGSNAGVSPGEGSNLAYAASKAGLDMLIKNISIAMGPKIRAVSVCPGALKTNWIKRSEEFYKHQIDQTPLKRLGTSDDIAQTVEALITHLKFVTGSTIVVDGGKSL
jgi:3-oxoacyl-[acyl-carrier protein] reductase